MALFIQKLHDRINFATKKGLTGYHSPAQIDNEVNAESMNLWLKYTPLFEKDSDIAAILDPFKRNETVTLTSGTGSMTAAFQRPTGVFTSGGIKIDIVDIGMWADRINHPLKTPTTDYPACYFANQQIIVRPTSLTQAIVHYLKYPTTAVYGYAINGTRYVYDDATSVDFDWPKSVHDQVMNRVLSNLGINIRELMTLQYAQQEKAQEGK